MILAGGQGSRLGALTKKIAKPAVPFGGKYRIIDFPLSNCANSGIDKVGVLTQYRPLELHNYLGTGDAWDLDKSDGGVFILPPYARDKGADWYKGTADAIYQNLNFIDMVDPEYVLVLSGDHIYTMDYAKMLAAHRANKADATIGVFEVPWDEAPRFGIMNTDEKDGRIVEFEEKPAKPKSNLASMGIYIFSWDKLKEALLANEDVENCDFGMHVIPYCHEKGERIFAYEYTGYWKDVGTLKSYWEANMELIDLIPVFNLYEDYWKIYTKSDVIAPQYISPDSHIDKAIIGEGCEIDGKIYSSVIGSNVRIGKGSVIRDSIIMEGVTIGEGVTIEKGIIAEGTVIGDHVQMGVGEEVPSKLNDSIYTFGLVTIGENSVIPSDVKIGKNTTIAGATDLSDYPDGLLASGEYIVKAGDNV